MKRKRPKGVRGQLEGPLVHSISVTDEEWDAVQKRAQRVRARSISQYAVERALKVDLQEDPEAPRLVLNEAEQHALLENLTRIAERTVSGTEANETIMRSLRNAVALVVDATMLEMTRDGRDDEMEALLVGLFGDDEAATIRGRFAMRMKARGLLDA